MGKANDFVSKAASQIGITEQPANSNNTKYGAWYGMNGEPWCDMFVSWCANEIGAIDVVGKFAYCPYHVNWFKQQGRWLSREAQPQPGDVVFFANNGVACHVGIVESRNGSSSITSIEGNTSAGDNANGGQVQRRNRTYGSVGSSWYILGFGRPNWESIERDEFDMATVDEVVEGVWNKAINGKSAQDRLYLCNVMDYSTDDPTGRGVGMNDHDHIKWIAAGQAAQNEVLENLEAKISDLTEMVEKISDKISESANDNS